MKLLSIHLEVGEDFDSSEFIEVPLNSKTEQIFSKLISETPKEKEKRFMEKYKKMRLPTIKTPCESSSKAI